MKIEVDVINKNDSDKIDGYKLSISLSNDVEVCKKLSEYEMNNLLNDIETVLGYKPIMEKFSCTVKDAKDIKEAIDRNRYDCKDCKLQLVECYRCCKVCESPLERKLLKSLIENDISVELQLRINKDNTISHYPEAVNSEKILTIPDFYLETENKKICIYTDGHTYHERTEYQAVRDRSIDRELQNLGYEVLRFTTSEINKSVQDVVNCIKKSMQLIDSESFEFINDKKVENGSCIRCGTKIFYDNNHPLCNDCYETWSQFRNMDYLENYCHKCGKQFDNISYSKPICKNCL